MNLITGPRASGKTYKLVDWYKEDPANRRIICRDESDKRRIEKEYTIDPKHVFALTNARSLRGLRGEFGLDVDLEDLIRGAVGLDAMQALGPVTLNTTQ